MHSWQPENTSFECDFIYHYSEVSSFNFLAPHILHSTEMPDLPYFHRESEPLLRSTPLSYGNNQVENVRIVKLNCAISGALRSFSAYTRFAVRLYHIREAIIKLGVSELCVEFSIYNSPNIRLPQLFLILQIYFYLFAPSICWGADNTFRFVNANVFLCSRIAPREANAEFSTKHMNIFCQDKQFSFASTNAYSSSPVKCHRMVVRVLWAQLDCHIQKGTIFYLWYTMVYTPLLIRPTSEWVTNVRIVGRNHAKN